MSKTHNGFLLVDALVMLAIVTSLVTSSSLALSALTSARVGIVMQQSVVTEAMSKLEAIARTSFFGNGLADALSAALILEVAAIATPDPDTLRFSLFLPELHKEVSGTARAEARITNPSAPLLSCDPFVSASWNSVTVEPLLQLQIPFGARPSAIAWRNNLATFAFSETSTATSSSLIIADMQRWGIPSLTRAQFDNAPSSRVGYSALVWTSTNTLIAANRFGSASPAVCSAGLSCAQVHVYSAPLDSLSGSVPTLLLHTFSLATTTQPFATRSGGATAGATALAASSTLLAVGLERTERGMEFNLVDIQNPQQLRWLGGLRIGRSINTIAFSGTTAFVGTDDPAREVIAINVSNPASPYISGSWDAPGAQNFGIPVSVHTFGDTLIVGRSYVGNAPELFVLSASTLTPIASVEIGIQSAPDGIRAIAIQDFLIVALTQRTIQTFQLHDAVLTLKNKTLLPSGSEGTTLSCIGGRFFTGLWNPSSGSGSLFKLRGL